MKFFIIVVLIAVVESRPQNEGMFHPEPSVQIERQKIVEFKPELKPKEDPLVEKHTLDILEKIKEVNKQHGYASKAPKFPKNVAPIQHFYTKSNERQIKEYNFQAFPNPIFEYINNHPLITPKTGGNKLKGFYNAETNNNADILPEDESPGEIIKRKVTHHQTYVLPNMYEIPQGYEIPNALPQIDDNQVRRNIYDLQQEQSVNNIKSIMDYSLQVPQMNPYYANPYSANLYSAYPYSANPYYYPAQYNYPNYVPPQQTYQNFARQSTINIPFQEFFPIIIRNPFQMMFNAFTSMVEYGQAVSGTCTQRAITKSKHDALRSAKLLDKKDEYRVENSADNDGAVYNFESNRNGSMMIEELDLNATEPIKESRELSKPKLPIFRPSTWFNNKATYNATQNKPHIDQLGEHIDSEEDEIENFDTKGIFGTHSMGTKNMHSEDNTGSGIFIHKLKVRKGGVAIAGPGGIATAGSGGTAIVGPNGFAFTHPDSLAIAGSGTKVVAVDPSINLSDLVSNNHNKTRFDGSSPRVGKVVATGPVIYYNKGDPKTPIKITLLPFYGGAKGQTLQITESSDGSVSTEVIQTPLEAIKPESSIYELEHPELPSKYESEYGQNIKNIHRNALNIIKLQEAAKKNGLTETDEAAYKEYIESLNQSAHNLAKIYEGEDDDDDNLFHNRAGLSSWFARKKTNTKKDKDKDKKKEEDKRKEEERKKKEEDEKKRKEEERKEEERKKKEEERKKKEEEEEKKKKAEEEAKKEAERKKKQEEKENEKEEEEEDEDGVSIGLPSEEASVAEAKPVGLAVAGIGGVAASKPIATAVVGPGGLAIARPVGTAIAGVSPDQALVPIYAEGFVVPTKTKGNKDEKKHIHSTEYLNKIISKYHQA